MSSSAEAVGARAWVHPRTTYPDAWALPGTGGEAVLPWVARITGPDGMLEELTPAAVEALADGVIEVRGLGTSFEAVLRLGGPGPGGGRDLALEVRCVAPIAVPAAVGIVVALGGVGDPWFLVPGLFYGQNRPAGTSVRYPRWRSGPPDDDALASERWTFRADRAATPLVLASDGRRSVALSTGETGDLGPVALVLGADGTTTEIGIVAPFAELPVVYDGGERARPGVTTYRRWAPGERGTVRARLHLADPGRHAFAPILRDLHQRGAKPAPAAAAPATPGPADTAAIAAEGLLRWHWRREDRALLETAAFERGASGTRAGGGDGPGTAAGEAPGDRRAMHTGWVSGIPTAAALLVHGRRAGDDVAAGAAIDVIDNVCEHLAPAGTFWAQWTSTGGWGRGWTPGADRVHARTIAEATLFAARALEAEAALGMDHEGWRRAAASNLAFAAGRQRADGALGSSYDGRTGAVGSWAGTAGLAWVPALVEGAAVLGERAWLETARRAGEAYAPDLDRAFLHGAPEDVDLAPTSEDGYVAVMAYTALAEAAAGGERSRWLELARRAADWMLTFRYTYDVVFPDGSLLERYGYRSRGMDQASVANQHLHAYGLVCVPELVRLSRLLEDPWYADRAREHLVASRQLLVRVDGEANGRRGMAPERFYQCDCFGPKGGIGMLSHAWCLGLLVWANEAALAMPELADDRGAGDG